MAGELTGADGAYKSRQEIEALLVKRGVDLNRHIICTCGFFFFLFSPSFYAGSFAGAILVSGLVLELHFTSDIGEWFGSTGLGRRRAFCSSPSMPFSTSETSPCMMAGTNRTSLSLASLSLSSLACSHRALSHLSLTTLSPLSRLSLTSPHLSLTSLQGFSLSKFWLTVVVHVPLSLSTLSESSTAAILTCRT